MAAFLEVPEKTKDFRLNLLLAASVVTAVAMVIIALVAVPKILSSASTTDALKRGNEITACRAEARGEVDEAGARLQDAQARLAEITNEGIEEFALVLQGEHAEFGPLVARLPAARKRVTDAADVLSAATVDYRSAVVQSRQDPAEFVRTCRAG